MKIKPSIIIGTTLVIIGAVIGYQPYSRLFTGSKNKGTFDSYVANRPLPSKDINGVISGKPVSIQINSLKINLPVVDGFYDKTKQDWSLTPDKAQYATTTPLSNNYSGNTFIYGHDNSKVFMNLHKLKVGDEVVIKTSNGHTFKYVFRSSLETNPYDGSLFKYQGPSILTLQTCSGVRSQNRQLFTFDFKEVV